MKYLKIILGFGVFLLVTSCVKNTYPKPDPFLNKEQMAKVFIDIHILEAKIELLKLKPDSALAVYRAAEDKNIWQKNGITKEQFKANHDYYIHDSENLDKIYSSVVDSLGALESRFMSKIRKRNKK